MEFFRSLLRSIGLYEPTKVDIVAELPMEVSQLIFRKLDPETILNIVQVSRKWKETCQSDPVLRRQVREYLKKEVETSDFGVSLSSDRSERKVVPVPQALFLRHRHSRFVGLDVRRTFGNVAHGSLTVSNVAKVGPRTKSKKKNGGVLKSRGLRI